MRFERVCSYFFRGGLLLLLLIPPNLATRTCTAAHIAPFARVRPHPPRRRLAVDVCALLGLPEQRRGHPVPLTRPRGRALVCPASRGHCGCHTAGVPDPTHSAHARFKWPQPDAAGAWEFAATGEVWRIMGHTRKQEGSWGARRCLLLRVIKKKDQALSFGMSLVSELCV